MNFVANDYKSFRPIEPPTQEQIDALLSLEEALVQDRPDDSLRVRTFNLLERLKPSGATIVPSSVDLCESIEPWIGRSVTMLGDCCTILSEPERGIYREFARAIRDRFGLDGGPPA